MLCNGGTSSYALITVRSKISLSTLRTITVLNVDSVAVCCSITYTVHFRGRRFCTKRQGFVKTDETCISVF